MQNKRVSNYWVYVIVATALTFYGAYYSIITLHRTSFLIISRPFQVGPFPLNFQFDDMTRLFLLISVVVLIAIMFSQAEYLHSPKFRIARRLYLTAFTTLVLCMFAVVSSADAFTFLFFWELMSIASSLLVISDRSRGLIIKSGLIYIGATRLAGCFLAAGFLWMHVISKSWLFSQWSFSEEASYPAASLIILGFAIKLGVWPVSSLGALYLSNHALAWMRVVERADEQSGNLCHSQIDGLAQFKQPNFDRNYLFARVANRFLGRIARNGANRL